jgi:hypothetical protein
VYLSKTKSQGKEKNVVSVIFFMAVCDAFWRAAGHLIGKAFWSATVMVFTRNGWGRVKPAWPI